MAISLQVLYPIDAGERFDYDYYVGTHMPLVAEHMGAYIEKTLVTKGVSGGPDSPAAYFAVATMTFADQAAFDAALKASRPALDDIPNFTDVQPTMLFGEVIAT